MTRKASANYLHCFAVQSKAVDRLPQCVCLATGKAILANSSRGFTLIEIMVVMVIVAVLAGTVSLVIGDNQQRHELENEARRLVALLDLTQDEAVFQNIEIGLQLDQQGYSFRALDEAKLSWISLPQDFLKNRTFPDWMTIDLQDSGNVIQPGDNEGEAVADAFSPQVLFFSSGESTPFLITLGYTGGDNFQYLIRSDGLNGVTLEEPGASDD